jgi:outer membrane protein OmpU
MRLTAPALALCLAAAPAVADVRLSGDARLGLHSPLGADTALLTSRVRVRATASGQTDSGLDFGATGQLSSPGLDTGKAGTVFLAGTGWRLTIGDVEGAAAAANGQVAPVGLTELGSWNNLTYIANGGTVFGVTRPRLGDTADPSARLTLSPPAGEVFLAATSPASGPGALSLGFRSADAPVRFGIGVESQGAARQAIASVQLRLGRLAAKAIRGVVRSGRQSTAQGAASLALALGPATVSAFYTDDARLGGTAGARAAGIGVTRDLGQGVSLRGGLVRNLTAGTNAFDLGLNLSF